ncbi:MAG: hypothetical protein HFH82_06025 [Lachnospiraceae bacterium]|nr:hypothetical protein [Lachnospiraceae bacterium]
MKSKDMIDSVLFGQRNGSSLDCMLGCGYEIVKQLKFYHILWSFASVLDK